MGDIDDHDLASLRAFRADDAVPPVGLLDRLRDDLQLAIDAERAVPVRAVPSRARTWRQYFEHRLFRPALVAGAAATLVVAVAGVSAFGNRDRVATTGSSSATQASTSVFDGTAQSLFGSGSSAAAPPVVGVLDTTDRADASDITRAIAARSRDSDDYDLLRRLTRDPGRLRDTLRTTASDVGDSPATSDQIAFVLAMRLVIDDQLPGDLRAAVLRSVGGLEGIEAAAYVSDDLGRAGVLISHLDPASGVRDQYVLDPSSGAALQQRSFASVYVDPACPPGTFTAFHLYDESSEELTPQQLPTLDWPVVVTSCSPAAAI